jgi:formamidopyrimidine-DNA glycosylase
MPELPEVETIRLGLQKTIIGKKITRFESLDSKVVQFTPEDIKNSKIINIGRKAKMLHFDLDNKKSILIHLKMTGQLIWEKCGAESKHCLKKSRVAGGHPSPDWIAILPTKHTRAIFSFNDGSKLFFNDLRRFGYMKLYDTKLIQNSNIKNQNLSKHSVLGPLETIPELAKLGPEPFSHDFNVEYLMEKASKIPNRKIKQFITDQEIISGVGNIYVDEALFYAGISPLRPVKEIKLKEWTKIIESIKKALELGLKYGGSSEDTYVDAFGNQGTMGEHTKVYRKTGQSCLNGCGGTIQRITLGGRSTHYCETCQK